MRRQATYWKKIFAKDIFEKELLSKIYKEHLKLNNKKTDMGQRPEQTSQQTLL